MVYGIYIVYNIFIKGLKNVFGLVKYYNSVGL